MSNVINMASRTVVTMTAEDIGSMVNACLGGATSLNDSKELLFQPYKTGPTNVGCLFLHAFKGRRFDSLVSVALCIMDIQLEVCEAAERGEIWSFDELKAQWGGILEKIKLTGLSQSMCHQLMPLGISDDSITLEVPSEFQELLTPAMKLRLKTAIQAAEPKFKSVVFVASAPGSAFKTQL